MAEIDTAPRLNAVSRDKKSASVRQADVPTNLSPTKNLQLCDKKSASVRRPLDHQQKPEVLHKLCLGRLCQSQRSGYQIFGEVINRVGGNK